MDLSPPPFSRNRKCSGHLMTRESDGIILHVNSLLGLGCYPAILSYGKIVYKAHFNSALPPKSNPVASQHVSQHNLYF